MFDSLIIGAGISGMADKIITDWLGPVFILAVAAFAIVFVKDRAWMKLLGFVGISAIVGCLVYFGKDFFSDTGSLSGVAKSKAGEITEAVNFNYHMAMDIARGVFIKT